MNDEYVVVQAWEDSERFDTLGDTATLEDAQGLINRDISFTKGEGWRATKLNRIVHAEVAAMYRAFNHAQWKADGAREGSEDAYVDKGSTYMIIFKPQSFPLFL